MLDPSVKNEKYTIRYVKNYIVRYNKEYWILEMLKDGFLLDRTIVSNWQKLSFSLTILGNG